MIPETKKPSIKVRLVAIWLWLNSFYYLLNAVLFSALILTFVYLEITLDGSRFVILQDNYPLILFPLFFSFLSFLYQHNSFKLLTLTKKSFYMAFFLIVGHFIFNLIALWSVHYLLSSLPKAGYVSPDITTLIGFNIFIIIPVIAVILLVLSYKEFEYLKKKLSTKASLSIILVSVIPIVLSLILIIWGTTEVIDTDYNFSKAQNQASFVIYKANKIPEKMYYITKYKYSSENDSVSFTLTSKTSSDTMIFIYQNSSIKKNSSEISNGLINSCKADGNDCEIKEVNIPNSKTGKGMFIGSPNENQYSISYDSKNGTTVWITFVYYTLDKALEFIEQLK